MLGKGQTLGARPHLPAQLPCSGSTLHLLLQPEGGLARLLYLFSIPTYLLIKEYT